MRRLFLALSLCVAFLTSACLTPERVESSIRIMSIFNEEHNGFCTAWSYDEKQGYFVAAAHCAPDGYSLEIDEKPVTLVKIDADKDLALFQADVHIPALPISTHAPQIGDPLAVVGIHIVRGIPVISWHYVRVMGFGFTLQPIPSLLVTKDAGAGTSGSPILDKSGVVGVYQCGNGVRGCGSAYVPFLEFLGKPVPESVGSTPQGSGVLILDLTGAEAPIGRKSGL